jgi:putative spermidine/putrescine transport system substrate-binding protein
MQKIRLMGTAILGLAVATSPVVAQITAIGDSEGQVNIVAWAGYIERGESDTAFDWVTKFEAASGCKVNVKTATWSPRPAMPACG